MISKKLSSIKTTLLLFDLYKFYNVLTMVMKPTKSGKTILKGSTLLLHNDSMFVEFIPGVVRPMVGRRLKTEKLLYPWCSLKCPICINYKYLGKKKTLSKTIKGNCVGKL